MFRKIVIPVDLAHAERLDRVLRIGADLARHYKAELCFLGVTTTTPGPVARTPEEFGQKLEAFAQEQSAQHGVTTSSIALVDHDPSVQLDRTLLEATENSGADLVVMATHLPNVTDYIWSGHGAYLATHSEASVMLVRG
ncbi:universal stress protein [Ruegeria marina]|uniref:Nucleotide-binding universal stress protein, UspA family n=1 Tax=Ruegeria marina TaxID=639004 RepID=A0A1G6ZQB0_9RHOB|nr:universal stress protein [Ruegeria marina]SDE04858.1 Nucleotide-binding universal stress protein, UspA family [Ruegeria marina]